MAATRLVTASNHFEIDSDLFRMVYDNNLTNIKDY